MEKFNGLDLKIREMAGRIRELREIESYTTEFMAEKTGISVAEIYGVVTFYSYFSLEPKGKYVIGVCLGTACFVRGADKILKEFEARLGIKNGETTEDGKFTLSSLRCVGACGLAPVVQVNGKTYGNATIETVKEIIEEYSNMED